MSETQGKLLSDERLKEIAANCWRMYEAEKDVALAELLSDRVALTAQLAKTRADMLEEAARQWVEDQRHACREAIAAALSPKAEP